MLGKNVFESYVLQRYAELDPQLPVYPEVTVLHEAFGEEQLRFHIRRGNGALIPKSLSLDVHVPEGSGNSEYYVEQLLREIEMVAPLFDQDRDVVGLQWSGAGYRLGPELSDRILGSVRRRFHVVETAVCSACIALDATAVESGGIPACQVRGTDRVDLQIRFGLARQSLAGFASAMQAVVASGPDSIDLVDGALMLQNAQADAVLDAATRLSMLECAIDIVTAAGYAHVCKGRFELEARESRVFDGDLVGIGPGSVSMTGDGVSENFHGVREWQSALDAGCLPVARGTSLTREDRQRADLLRRLLCAENVDIAFIERYFGAAYDQLECIGQLEDHGLVRSAGQRVIATSRGRHLWRILAGCFDPDRRLPGSSENQAARHVEGNQRGGTPQ